MTISGKSIVTANKIGSVDSLVAELLAAGVKATTVARTRVDPVKVVEKTGLTVQDFANTYGFPPRTFERWYQHRKAPSSANAMLLAIMRDPEGMARKLED